MQCAREKYPLSGNLRVKLEARRKGCEAGRGMYEAKKGKARNLKKISFANDLASRLKLHASRFMPQASCLTPQASRLNSTLPA